MKKTYIKNLSLICLIMILIHLAGLTYQFITSASFFAIILKLLYIVMFSAFLYTLVKDNKYSYLLGIISSCIIIIISSIYMDFLSVVIALLVIFYSYNLKGCYNENYIKITPIMKKKVKNKNINNNKTINKNKKKTLTKRNK